MPNISKFTIFFVVIPAIFLLSARVFTIQAQQNISSTQDILIPSDLSLDLNLAQQNPSPDQKAIISSEIKKAELITNAGKSVVLNPQDIVRAGVKTEPRKDAMNPNQSTSEQVVSTYVVVEETVTPTANQSQPAAGPSNSPDNGSPVPTGEISQPSAYPSQTIVPSGSAYNLVPGTTVVSPDDNAAPADNSTDPNLPAPTSSDSQSNSDQQPTMQPGSGDNSQPTNPPSSASTTDSTTNQQSQSQTNNPTSSPDSNSGQQQSQSNPPATDNSGNSSSQQDNSSSSNTDNSVQGVSIGPKTFMQRIASSFKLLLRL